MASSRVVGNQATAPQRPNDPNPNPNPNSNPTPAPAPTPTPTPAGGCIQCNSARAVCHPESVAGCERCNDEGIKCSLKCWTCEKNHKTCVVNAGSLSCVKCNGTGETCVPGPLDRAEVRTLRLTGSQGPTEEYIDAHIRRVQAGLFGPRPNRVSSSTATSSTAAGKRGARRGISSSSRGTSSAGSSRKRKAPEELGSDQDDSYMPGRSSVKLFAPMSKKNKKSKASEELDTDEEDSVSPGSLLPKHSVSKNEKDKKPEVLMNDPISRATTTIVGPSAHSSTSTPAAPVRPYGGGHGAFRSLSPGRSAPIRRSKTPRISTLIYPNADEANANAGRYWLVQKHKMESETSHLDSPTSECSILTAPGPAAPSSAVNPPFPTSMQVTRNINSARQKLAQASRLTDDGNTSDNVSYPRSGLPPYGGVSIARNNTYFPAGYSGYDARVPIHEAARFSSDGTSSEASIQSAGNMPDTPVSDAALYWREMNESVRAAARLRAEQLESRSASARDGVPAHSENGAPASIVNMNTGRFLEASHYDDSRWYENEGNDYNLGKETHFVASDLGFGK